METSESTDITLKNQLRAKQIVDKLSEGKTYVEISSELNLSRSKLYALMNREDVKQLMIAEVTGMETMAQRMIQELDDDGNPANKRHALTELGKLIRHTKDKLYPSIFQNLNVNVNIDPEEYESLRMYEQVTLSAVARLPPECRDRYLELYKEVRREWGWDKPRLT